MSEDLISRAAALEGIERYRPEEPEREETPMERVNRSGWECAINCAESFVRTMPPAHPEEATTVFGYPVRHLAAIAKALEDEDITPENVANLVSEMGYIAEKMIGELNRLGEKWVALFGEEEEG